MTGVDLLAAAGQIAIQTVQYLLAYPFVLVLAPLAHLALLAMAPLDRGWVGGEKSHLGWLAAGLAGLTCPLSQRAIEANLRRAGSVPAAIVYLAASHALTAYYWILLGPLLGKDFLLSHVVGVILFVALAAPLVHALGVRLADRPAGGPPADVARPALPGLLGRAALRYLLLVTLGLMVGGLVGAWGLSPWAWVPADVAGAGVGTQLVNGFLGLAITILAVPPVANLFMGTYLWKVGLAHAGIVAFFCAATAAPTRWRIYARVFGPSGGLRVVVALLAAALLAGVATAWLFGATGVEIRYRLIPEQLWGGR